MKLVRPGASLLAFACVALGGCSPDRPPPPPASRSGYLPAALPVESTRVVPPRADSLFREGRALIEANCGECYQAQIEGLRRGIDDVSEALGLGFPDSAVALNQLAAAYRGMAYAYAEARSPEQREWELKLRDALRSVAGLRPSDPDAAYQYAMSLSQPTEQIAALEQVLAIDSTHALASYVLGIHLVDQGDTAQGLPLLFRAGVRLTGPDAEALVPHIILALREHGHAGDADSVQAVARARAGTATGVK